MRFARFARSNALLELYRHRIAFFGQTESGRVEFAIVLTEFLLTCWEVLADIFVLDERGTPTACTEMFDA